MANIIPIPAQISQKSISLELMARIRITATATKTDIWLIRRTFLSGASDFKIFFIDIPGKIGTDSQHEMVSC
jgi:hypothetical protein